ncbi:hypothetical protein U1Q18_022260 [Sarracenia purpurea var. burkii]
MATTLGNGDFWLPSEFLADDETLVGKENLNKKGLNTACGANFCFPTEFPYEVGGSYGWSSVLSSPVESVKGSTETESDEEDLLASLTRHFASFTLQEKARKIASAPQHLEKSWALASSPESTLSAVGSWSGQSAVSSAGSPDGPSQVPSPTTTPLGGQNDAWDLIFAAAGQVAMLKMNAEGPPRGRGLLGPPRILTPSQHHPPSVKNLNSGFYANQCHPHNLSQTNHIDQGRHDQILNQQCSSIWGRPTRDGFVPQQNQVKQQLMSQNRERVNGGVFESHGRYSRPLGLPQSSWPPLQVQNPSHQNQPSQHSGSGMRAVFLGGAGGSCVKRKCAGTGVFLPRRYGNPSESRKKPGCSTALIPARVVHALSKNFDDVSVQSHPPAQPQPRIVTGFPPDYDILMARKNSILAQQKHNLRSEGGMNHELCLPQEWTY